MEQIFIAEAELQKCLSEMNLDISSEAEELEMFVPLGSTPPSLSAARTAIKHIYSSGSDREKKVFESHFPICLFIIVVWLYA